LQHITRQYTSLCEKGDVQGERRSWKEKDECNAWWQWHAFHYHYWQGAEACMALAQVKILFIIFFINFI